MKRIALLLSTVAFFNEPASAQDVKTAGDIVLTLGGAICGAGTSLITNCGSNNNILPGTAGDLGCYGPGSTQVQDCASAGAPSRLGSSLFPTYVLPVSTTATTTMGLNTITVTSATGIVNGMSVWMTGVFATLPPSYVTNVSGTTVTISNNALATESTPTAIQFGQAHYSSTSTLLVNSIGAEYGRFGAAAVGSSDWMAQFAQGSQSISVAPLVSLSAVGTYGALFGSHTADNPNANSGNSVGVAIFGGVDNLTVQNSYWGIYNQFQVIASADVNAMYGAEFSPVNLYGSGAGAVDPYNANGVSGTVNIIEDLRLDAGYGHVATSDATTAIHIIGNAAKFNSGAIVVDNGALDTAVDANMCALCLPENISIAWFGSNGSSPATKTWEIYSSAAAAAGLQSIQLTANQAIFSQPIEVPNGTASAPGLQLGSNGGGGFGLYGNGTSVFITASNTELAFFNTVAGAFTIPLVMQKSASIGTSALPTLSQGELGFAKITASGTAPGAAVAKIAVVCGSNSGTAQIIAYAGTSTTPVTIANNIGSGVTGC